MLSTVANFAKDHPDKTVYVLGKTELSAKVLSNQFKLQESKNIPKNIKFRGINQIGFDWEDNSFRGQGNKAEIALDHFVIEDKLKEVLKENDYLKHCIKNLEEKLKNAKKALDS